MVQRKAPPKPGSQSQAKRNHVSSHQQQDARSKGGGDLKKKMKKVRSIKASNLESLEGSAIKASSPNYMKPTSSWDARKEQLQVTFHSHATTDKKTSPKNLKILNSSKPPSSSSPSGSGIKTSLSRQSSLKPVRPLMKRNSKNGIVKRATCSSTLKDSKFPKALDLNPGGTEVEGTSIMKVCPYTYCSLNGHRHEPLPPLKCFMSARRKLLRTQKSMKLKGLSPFRGKGFGKGEKEIDTGQRGLEIAPLMEEVAKDFFVEIYTTKPQEQIIEPGILYEKGVQTEDCTEKPEVLGELAEIGNSEECARSEVDEDEQMNESDSDISFDDDIDQISELSNEELDVMMGFLEYVECDQQREEDKEANILGLVPEYYAEWGFECCLVDVSSKDGEGVAQSQNKESAIDATDMDLEEEVGQFPDNKSEYSECPDDGFGPIYPCDELPIEPPDTSIASDVAEADAELSQEVIEEVAENGDSSAVDDGSLEGDDADSDHGEEISRLDVSDVNSKPQEPESSEENDQGDASVVEGDGTLSTKENISDSSFQGSEKEVTEEPEGSETVYDIPEHDNDENCILESDDLEAQQNLEIESIEEEENGNEEVDDTSSLFVVQISDSGQGFTEADQGITESNCIQTELENKVSKCGDAIEDESISPEVLDFPSGAQSDESNTQENLKKSEKEQQEDASMQKARVSIMRNITTEEPEQMKEFNPRGPRFLPVEPDPDAEKVDLRHQLIDERKNAEEWMIDYALQRAVNNLAPARKRKVALLVEAFETVTPLPMCEKPLRHSTSGFAHARPIQACS